MFFDFDLTIWIDSFRFLSLKIFNIILVLLEIISSIMIFKISCDFFLLILSSSNVLTSRFLCGFFEKDLALFYLSINCHYRIKKEIYIKSFFKFSVDLSGTYASNFYNRFFDFG
ncbi:hypothetical protein BpHYR1_038235 [Brachionus plicatilis]|uniref:Uncharacterized protein n=1 Tax=Brachionus plicatilis TaxID=10195 RepID=A0A3M7Q3K3_BRAPC|nr:hypothetical protein BpHYR1_038235 [Brachionus plicatilis]